MEFTGANADREIALLRKELEQLKDTIARADAEQLPIVDMLLKDNARRIEAEQHLGEARRWMELAQETGGVATYSMDIATGKLWWSQSAYRLYGLDMVEGEPSLEWWLSTIHPDDRDVVGNVAELAIAEGRAISHQFRIVRPADGEMRWIYDRGSVECDPSGRPIRIYGVNIDLTDVRRAQSALHDSELQFRGTFEHANVGFAHVSLDGQFLRANEALCRILGRPRDELQSATFQQLTHPDDLDADMHLLNQLLAGEIDSYSMEKRYLRPDGSAIWCDLSVSLLRHADGSPRNFISIIADIDERKKAQDQVDLILGESNHRVKNLLAVIGVIVSSSARSAEKVEDLEHILTSRLMGIAASHDMLMGKYVSGAPLSNLVRRQMDIFTGGSLDRISIEGADIDLKPRAVHAFGMVLHELATNACKYGALSNADGRVAISWTVDTAAGKLDFRWLESGGPPVAVSGRKGFGTRALERMLTGALGGTAMHSFPVEGATYSAVIPLHEIQAML